MKGRTVHRTNEWKGHGGQNHYWNEYGLEGDMAVKYECGAAQPTPRRPCMDAVINGGLVRTPWPVKWWSEDGNRMWIALAGAEGDG